MSCFRLVLSFPQQFWTWQHIYLMLPGPESCVCVSLCKGFKMSELVKRPVPWVMKAFIMHHKITDTEILKKNVCLWFNRQKKKKAHEYSDIVFASILWPGSWGDENWRRESSVTHTGENKRAGTEVSRG